MAPFKLPGIAIGGLLACVAVGAAAIVAAAGAILGAAAFAILSAFGMAGGGVGSWSIGGGMLTVGAVVGILFGPSLLDRAFKRGRG